MSSDKVSSTSSAERCSYGPTITPSLSPLHRSNHDTATRGGTQLHASCHSETDLSPSPRYASEEYAHEATPSGTEFPPYCDSGTNSSCPPTGVISPFPSQFDDGTTEPVKPSWQYHLSTIPFDQQSSLLEQSIAELDMVVPETDIGRAALRAAQAELEAQLRTVQAIVASRHRAEYLQESINTLDRLNPGDSLQCDIVGATRKALGAELRALQDDGDGEER